MEPTPVAVRAIRTVGPDTVAVELDAPPGFDAEPGQFVRLLLDVDGTEEVRFYTVSSPRVGDTFEVTVAVDAEGAVGPRLAAMDPGDAVRVAGPFGRAHYEGEERVTVVAGGPGVGPAVAIAERVLDEGGEAAVVYGDDDPAHVSRLSAAAAAGARVYLVRGDVGPAVRAAVDDVDGQVFVYGFADFVEGVADELAAAGCDPDAAKLESFG